MFQLQGDAYYNINYRAAVCDVICLEATVLLGGKTTERLYGNGRKFALFLLTSPALVIEHLQYYIPVSVTSNYGSACDYCVYIFVQP